MNPMPPQQQAPQNPQQQAAPQAQPEEQYVEGSEESSSLDPEEVQMLLFSRVEQLTPQEAQAFAQMVTPQTADVLYKLMPELEPLLVKIIQEKSAMGGQSPAGGAPQGMPPGGAPRPPMPQQAQPQPQQAPQQRGNPLAEDDISKGLMG